MKDILKDIPDKRQDKNTTSLKFKKDLIQNQLAAKELYIAKYYISVQKWVPAINRLKNILKNYLDLLFLPLF